MKITFSDSAWQEYQYWQKTDKNIYKKINSLIKDINRTPFSGIGKPELLKFDLGGFWSRRINLVHRLIYQIDNDSILIYSCRFHYD